MTETLPSKADEPKKIWYASYGSNLCYEGRFMCYISGGTPVGSERANPGSRDKRHPIDIKPISLDFELYFAGYSKAWRGAPAFIRKGKPGSITYGRMYLISDDQFNDVVLQENGKPVDGTRFIPPFEQLNREKEFQLPGSPLYGSLLRIGQRNDCPVLTFTTGRDLEIGAPSEAYVKIIVSGMKETYPAMKTSDICEYLLHSEGLRNNIPAKQIASWAEEA